jgi:hypothetical protein
MHFITARTPAFVLRLAACFGELQALQALCQGCRALPLLSHSTDAQPLVSAHTRLIEASQAAAPCPLVVSKRVARICLTRHPWPKVA